MARRPRFVVEGLPTHVLWRGNARTVIAHDDSDCAELLTQLATAASAQQVAVHAYTVMPDHLHLVATAPSSANLSATLQALGRSYVRRFNQRYRRTGTLWEGRYRSTVVQPGAWVLSILRYVECNPVRAGLVDSADRYAWSSHRHWNGENSAAWLRPCDEYWALGNTPFERAEAWKRYCHSEPAAEELKQLRRHVHTGWPLGSPEFLAALAADTGRAVIPKRAGRPRRTTVGADP
jgi:putative transposase